MWSFSTEFWLFLSKGSSKIYSQRPNTMKETFDWTGILDKPS